MNDMLLTTPEHFGHGLHNTSKLIVLEKRCYWKFLNIFYMNCIHVTQANNLMNEMILATPELLNMDCITRSN